jgi:hypothetical protein
MPTTAKAPKAVWKAPPSMMPKVAVRPACLPPVSALATTKIMSMPGTMMMPASRMKNIHRASG